MAAAFSAGQTLTAANLIAVLPKWVIKAADESVNNAGTGTTLQNDDHLVLAGLANTTYSVEMRLLYSESAGTGIDLKCAWTQPTGCTLDLAVVGAHTAWNASAANVEVEFASWQADTGTTTGTRSFGSTNVANFSVHIRGTWRVGSTAGNLQFQWAQNTGSASNLTVKAGSSLVLTPLFA